MHKVYAALKEQKASYADFVQEWSNVSDFIKVQEVYSTEINIFEANVE